VLTGLADAGCGEVLEITQPLDYHPRNDTLVEIGVIVATLRSL